MRKRVVCIGGGTGQSQILRGLARYPLDITAIVGVTDNGGHSGVLRKIFGIPQVGDIRNCLTSLANDANPITYLLKYRFTQGELQGASLGNLIVVGLIQLKGSLSAGIDALRRQLGIPHRIIPVSDHSTQICAELADRRRIKGEWQIIRRAPRTPIVRLYHDPPVKCHRDCVKAIRRADMIVFCPGSLQTGVISALLTDGIREAIQKSKAIKVQICNIMTQTGQTDEFTAADHLTLLTQYLGSLPDVFVMNRARPSAKWLRSYREEGAKAVEPLMNGTTGVRILAADLLEPTGTDVMSLYQRSGNREMSAGPHYIRHDPAKLGNILHRLLKNGRPGRK